MLPHDYRTRVYAGVLGKIIGVYLGRPIENWSYQQIKKELSLVTYYVNGHFSQPIIVADDDISGTFTFLRALEDYPCGKHLTPQEVASTWLNYLIEDQTVLWWGGRGNSTEHTAYLNLKGGVPAPESGSAKLNGKVVSEQIGAQIFIDGWAMVAPGDPQLAARLAKVAASVSHDGEAIYGAQVIAAIESMAFIEPAPNKLIDTAVRLIPRDSVISRLIGDLRGWREKHGDWEQTRALLEEHYGYHKFGGGCHIVPNHGVVIMSLLYSNGDFARALSICNTSGWDTDCNSGNVGCIMGIAGGLEAINAGADWRGPVADRLLLPTADGGGCVTDAASVAERIVNIGRQLAGLEPQAAGPRFHFQLPGSVQGFAAEAPSAGAARVSGGEGRLNIAFDNLVPGQSVRAATATFLPAHALFEKNPAYATHASPTLYPGQRVETVFDVDGDHAALSCRLYIRLYGEGEELVRIHGPQVQCAPRGNRLEWKIPETGGNPIVEIGVEAASSRQAAGTIHLHYLTWDGQPEFVIERPPQNRLVANRAWTSNCQTAGFISLGEFRLIKNEGRGVAICGTRDWRDYRVEATLTANLARSMGVAARVQGLRRYYALVLDRGGGARLIKMRDQETTLGRAHFAWEFYKSYELALEVKGGRIIGRIGGRELFDLRDSDNPLECGAMGLLCEEGRVGVGRVAVSPA